MFKYRLSKAEPSNEGFWLTTLAIFVALNVGKALIDKFRTYKDKRNPCRVIQKWFANPEFLSCKEVIDYPMSNDPAHKWVVDKDKMQEHFADGPGLTLSKFLYLNTAQEWTDVYVKLIKFVKVFAALSKSKTPIEDMEKVSTSIFGKDGVDKRVHGTLGTIPTVKMPLRTEGFPNSWSTDTGHVQQKKINDLREKLRLAVVELDPIVKGIVESDSVNEEDAKIKIQYLECVVQVLQMTKSMIVAFHDELRDMSEYLEMVLTDQKAS